MTEFDSSYKEPRLSPEELNRQFYLLFEYLPVFITHSVPKDRSGESEEDVFHIIDIMFNSMAIRETSEYTKILRDKLFKILAYASITPTFRSYVTELIDHDILFGTEEFPYQNNWYWLADIGKSQSGIFNKNRARDMEREAFSLHLKIDHMEKTRDSLQAGLYIVSRLAKKEPPMIRMDFVKHLDIWRHQFIENYGENP